MRRNWQEKLKLTVGCSEPKHEETCQEGDDQDKKWHLLYVEKIGRGTLSSWSQAVIIYRSWWKHGASTACSSYIRRELAQLKHLWPHNAVQPLCWPGPSPSPGFPCQWREKLRVHSDKTLQVTSELHWKLEHIYRYMIGLVAFSVYFRFVDVILTMYTISAIRLNWFFMFAWMQFFEKIIIHAKLLTLDYTLEHVNIWSRLPS